MKHLRKVVLLVALTLATLLVACAPEAALPNKQVEVLRNDLAEGSLRIPHEISGERFDFITEYSTPYNASEWQITDSKTLFMQATIKPHEDGGEGVEVLVEHVHIDCNIQSEYAIMDGVNQDSMDDKLHVGTQPGFLVTEEYPYENYFAIEGYSQWLIEGWGYFNGSYGYTSLEQTRLTEGNLRERGGVVGNRFQVVYDLLIKYPGEDSYHTRSLVDEFEVCLGPLK